MVVGGLRRRQMAFLFACWLIEAVLCALFLHGDGRLVVPTTEAVAASLTPTLAANGTGAFSARRLDADAGYQPAFSLGWKNLHAESGRLGVFKTPLHKVIRIDDLQMEFYEQDQERAEEPVLRADGRQDSPADDSELAVEARFTEVFDAFRDEFGARTRGMSMDSPFPVDLSNVSKVIVAGLNYRVLRSGQLELGIRCRNAVATGSEIELRGTVLIQVRGRKLLSNYVLWDMESNRFSVPGTYILDCGGGPVRGDGVRCDRHLKPLGAPEVYSKKGA